MNANFRNFAIWVVIGLLLIALFNMFQNPGQTRRANEITYSELLSNVEAGNVSDVEIRGSRVNGHFRDKGGAFTTYAPEDPTLVDRMYKKGVRVSARPADDDVPTIMNVLVSWFPMLLLIAVWVTH